MKIAVIGLKPYYETDRIVYEGLKMGHEVVFLSKKNIVQTTFFGEFGIYFKVPTQEEQANKSERFKELSPIIIKPDSSLQPKMKQKTLLGQKDVIISELFDIRYFNIVIIREISRTLEWSTILANYLIEHKKAVIDQKIGTEMYYKSKLGTLYKASTNGFPYPKSFAVVSKDALITMLKYVTFPVIVKVIESSKGLGVFKFQSKQEVLDFFEFEGHKVKECMIQEVINYNGDIRVFVVGNKILGAMRREPQAGQWKGNVAQGAKAFPVEISEEIKKISLDIVKLQNSEIIGVDIMLPPTGPVIIETNRAPQFQGFESSTGVNVAHEIIIYATEKFSKISSS